MDGGSDEHRCLNEAYEIFAGNRMNHSL